MRLFEASAQTALILQGTEEMRISFSELRAEVEIRKERLAELPPAIGALTATRSLDFVATFVALLESGRPAAILSPDWPRAEIRARLESLGACVELDAEARSRGPLQNGGPLACHPETALVLFTSGSTARPHAVQLSLRNIQANSSAVIDSLGLASARDQALFLPLSYSFGLLGQLLPALQTGIPTRLLRNLVELKALLESENAPRMLSGVPSHWETLLKLFGPDRAICERMTHVVSAGAALSMDLRARLRKAFPRARVFSNYGQTELAPRVLCLSSDHPDFLTPATGFPVGRLQLRLAPDGELWVSGDQVMLGYLGEPEATSAKVRDGWLRTGDAAAIAPDGLVTVRGRMDELIKVGGERVSPLEIESALKSVAPIQIQDAGVTAAENSMYGSSLLAFLEVEDVNGFPLRKEELIKSLRERLTPSRLPSAIYLVARLPRTDNGKLQRSRLAALVESARRL